MNGTILGIIAFCVISVVLVLTGYFLLKVFGVGKSILKSALSHLVTRKSAEVARPMATLWDITPPISLAEEAVSDVVFPEPIDYRKYDSPARDRVNISSRRSIFATAPETAVQG